MIPATARANVAVKVSREFSPCGFLETVLATCCFSRVDSGYFPRSYYRDSSSNEASSARRSKDSHDNGLDDIDTTHVVNYYIEEGNGDQ